MLEALDLMGIYALLVNSLASTINVFPRTIGATVTKTVTMEKMKSSVMTLKSTYQFGLSELRVC